MTRPCSRIAILAIALFWQACPGQADDAIAPRWRRPSAAVLLEGGGRLAIANEATGSVTLFAVNSAGVESSGDDVLQWRSESPVAGRLTSLVQIPGTSSLLGTDTANHSLLLLQPDGDRIAKIADIPVPEHPMQVVVSSDGSRALVTSLWSRTLTLVAIDRTAHPPVMTPAGVLPIPFPPRLMTFLPGEERAVVADAFAGKLAVVNLAARTIESVRDLPGSNIGGMALSRDGKSLAVSHQITNRLARTTNDDIHWGVLAQNVVRIMEMEGLLDPDAVLYRRSEMAHLGQPGSGEADPAGLIDLGNGEWLVAISGVDEVVITRTDAAIRARVPVGDRPRFVVADAASHRAYIINQLSDSVSVIDTLEGELVAEASLGPTPELNAVARGERLFYDARLSHDRWLSCHSCHVEGHSTGQLVDTLSDGTFGTPKRILSMLGTRDANPWAWSGEFRELHEQVRQSAVSSMQGPPPSPSDVNDLVAFIHTLEPPPPRFRPTTDADRALVARGREVFDSVGCARCHIPTLTYTSDLIYDVGFVDESGQTKFNPPSLRGVSQRDSLFHDGRSKTLEEALVNEAHQLSVPLSESDLNALIQFLNSL